MRAHACPFDIIWCNFCICCTHAVSADYMHDFQQYLCFDTQNREAALETSWPRRSVYAIVPDLIDRLFLVCWN